MHIVSIGDTLYEKSKSVFWKKWEKYFKVLFADFFTQSAKRYSAKHLQQTDF